MALTQDFDPPPSRAGSGRRTRLVARTRFGPRADCSRPSHAWGAVAERIRERLGAPRLPDPPGGHAPESRKKPAAGWNGCSANARRWGRSTYARSMEAEDVERQIGTIEPRARN